MRDEKQKLKEWLSYLKASNNWGIPKIGFAYLCDKFYYDADDLLLYKYLLCSNIVKDAVDLLQAGNPGIDSLYESLQSDNVDHIRLAFFFEVLCGLYGEIRTFEYNADYSSKPIDNHHVDLRKQGQEKSSDYYYDLACAQKTNRGIEDWGIYVRYMEKASEMGHKHAMQCMARLYMRGKHVTKDEEKAVQLLKNCAVQKDGNSCYELYRFYHEKGNDKVNETRYLELASSYNHSAAQYDLAMVYYNNATESDYIKAVSLLNDAAKNGEPCAFYQLALCYRFGHGVSKDMNKAMEMLSEAAKLGHAEAKRIIG